MDRENNIESENVLQYGKVKGCPNVERLVIQQGGKAKSLYVFLSSVTGIECADTGLKERADIIRKSAESSVKKNNYGRLAESEEKIIKAISNNKDALLELPSKSAVYVTSDGKVMNSPSLTKTINYQSSKEGWADAPKAPVSYVNNKGRVLGPTIGERLMNGFEVVRDDKKKEIYVYNPDPDIIKGNELNVGVRAFKSVIGISARNQGATAILSGENTDMDYLIGMNRDSILEKGHKAFYVMEKKQQPILVGSKSLEQTMEGLSKSR